MRMRWEEHVARKREKRNLGELLVGMPETTGKMKM
jgi:hypothetical protein